MAAIFLQTEGIYLSSIGRPGEIVFKSRADGSDGSDGSDESGDWELRDRNSSRLWNWQRPAAVPLLGGNSHNVWDKIRVSADSGFHFRRKNNLQDVRCGSQLLPPLPR